MRGHIPVKFEALKGLWRRGDKSSCPPDHFTDCQNVDFDDDNVISRLLFSSWGEGVIHVRNSYVYRATNTVFLMVADDEGDLYKIDIMK